jgi:Carbamoyl-phosphate synthase L chain, ATP binding domain
MALAKAGCAVEVICPAGHPVERTNAAERIHNYRGLMPLTSFANAIASANPELLIPADDLATQHLHSLYDRELRQGKVNSAICSLIERSLGTPEGFPVVYARTAVMTLAREEGVRVPETKVISDTDDLKKWAAQVGFPFVLKADRTSGGTGVRVVHTFEEAEPAFRKLQAAPGFRRAIRQAWSEQDSTLLWPSVLRQRRTINAQAFISGREATSTVVCWQGTVLASLHFEVLHTAYSTGPATVVRWVQNVEMFSAAEKMARRLKLSGFYGFDFVFEGNSGNSYLIEMNPRATQAGHLTLGPGRDLPAALCAAISGDAVHTAPKVTENETIAFFPQEWLRDPASPFLRSGYHDVPWEESEFVRACVRGPHKRGAWHPEHNRIPALSTIRIPRL